MNYSNKWTDCILKAIQNAFLEIKTIIGTKEANKKHTIGAGGDLTLEIDKRAETVIIQTLESYNEPLIIVSEEIGKFFWDPVTKKRIFKFESSICSDYFIIDPIDGSTNAKRGIPFSCISIAYANGPTLNDIQVGAVFHIETEDMFLAEKKMGAFLNNNPIQCSQTKKLANSVGGTDMHIRDFCDPKIKQKNIILNHARKVRIIGASALEICMVAKGSLDFFIDFRGISRICDIAAAYLIVKEAGGFFMNDKGRAISKATNRFSLKKSYNLLVGCPGLKEIVKKKIISR